MSFILDALKKSEMERQRQNTPGLMDLPTRTRRRRLPVWAIALGALLVVNLTVLSVVLLKRSPPPQAPAAAGAAAPASRAARNAMAAPQAAAGAPVRDQAFSPMDEAHEAPVYAPEIPVASDESESARGTATPRAAAHPPVAESFAARETHRPDPLLTEPDPADSQEVLPTINEINAPALPELHLDVHVYATRAAERFVYVNMHKYHEGASLQEGPLVERIRRDGVVLNYQGLRFLLPRQP